jgi:hypothetical protein
MEAAHHLIVAAGDAVPLLAHLHQAFAIERFEADQSERAASACCSDSSGSMEG